MDNHCVCVCVGDSSISRMVFSMESEPPEKFWPLIKGPMKMYTTPSPKGHYWVTNPPHRTLTIKASVI